MKTASNRRRHARRANSAARAELMRTAPAWMLAAVVGMDKRFRDVYGVEPGRDPTVDSVRWERLEEMEAVQNRSRAAAIPGAEWVGAAAVARILGVSRSAVAAMVARTPPDAPGAPVLVGDGFTRKHWRWRRADVEQWARCAVEPIEPAPARRPTRAPRQGATQKPGEKLRSMVEPLLKGT